MASGWPSAVEHSCCPFNHCLCIWRRECPPSIPRVAPGLDYACIPTGGADDDDDSPAAWSILIGVKAGVRVTSLGLYRFGVARSGRVLGRSGDALEVVVDDLDYKAKRINSSSVHAAAATRSSDGRSLSLCLFSRERDFSFDNFESTLPGTPRPLRLNLALGAAADDQGLWAPYLTGINGPFDVVMQRLDEVAGNWVEVARFSSPEEMEIHREQRNIPVLQGVAVVDDTILLSLFPCHLFFTFNCSTLVWKAVVNYQKTQPFTPLYTPINGRGVYVEEDDAIYFLRGHSLYSYKLRFDQDQQQHSMMPPTTVARLSPFRKVITTFRVKGDGFKEQFAPKGIDVLHSTCRWLSRVPGRDIEPNCEFCFVQEYEEFSHENATPPAKRQRGYGMTPSILLNPRIVPVSSNDGGPSSMIDCCREFFNGTSFSHAVDLECSAIQINLDLYIVSQATACSIVYKINVYLKFLWEKSWERHRMCFEYVGKDTNSGSIMFCVLQDYSTCVDYTPDNTGGVCITTVQVKTEGLPNDGASCIVNHCVILGHSS
ncbi:hypothetical protein QOZ80_6BG0459260 [Eleusine coracana subsp. coracana]|nr:hypothetical protein QOZ80_6BG0459260 [Eleusine coracana subsp. coracana]